VKSVWVYWSANQLWVYQSKQEVSFQQSMIMQHDQLFSLGTIEPQNICTLLFSELAWRGICTNFRDFPSQFLGATVTKNLEKRNDYTTILFFHQFCAFALLTEFLRHKLA